MSPLEHPVPATLAAHTFSNAAAARCGITTEMLRGRRYLRLHHGVYAVRATRPLPERYLRPQMQALAGDYLPSLRLGEAFSHATALVLYGAPILAPAQLHLTITHPSGPARGRKVTGHRVRRPFATTATETGLPCVPPALALAQCGTVLPFRELVVAIDHLIKWSGPGLRRPPLVQHDRLAAQLAEYAAPGIDRVRAACKVARVGAESRYESLMHFEMARMGIDTLELQGELYDADGAWIGRFDALDRSKRKLVEFDGEQHRTDRATYLRDEVRLNRARGIGFEVLRLHREDFSPGSLPRTRATLCEFLGEAPRPVSRRLARYFAEPLR